MKLKIDEHLPVELLADLRAAGHEAETVPEGIILFRPRTSGRGAVLAFVRRHLPALLQADLSGHLLVVSERGIRIR